MKTLTFLFVTKVKKYFLKKVKKYVDKRESVWYYKRALNESVRK